MANLNVRIDEDLKRDVDKIFTSLGITSSDAIRMFFSQVRNYRGIPFELKLYDEPSAEALRIMKETENDLQAGRVSRCFNNSDELMAELLGQ